MDHQKWDAFCDQLRVKLISNEYINYIWKFEGKLARELFFSVGVNNVCDLSKETSSDRFDLYTIFLSASLLAN